MTRADRFAVAIVRSLLWRPLFWLARPLEHVGRLQTMDAFGEPITWRDVFGLTNDASAGDAPDA